MTTMTFGETVKAERVKRGWSQQVLANRAEMNRSHVGGIETKPGLPQYETIVSLAKAFGMTPRELLAPSGTSIMEAAAPHTVDVASDELVAIYDLLSESDRTRLIAIARALGLAHRTGDAIGATVKLSQVRSLNESHSPCYTFPIAP